MSKVPTFQEILQAIRQEAQKSQNLRRFGFAFSNREPKK